MFFSYQSHISSTCFLLKNVCCSNDFIKRCILQDLHMEEMTMIDTSAPSHLSINEPESDSDSFLIALLRFNGRERRDRDVLYTHRLEQFQQRTSHVIFQGKFHLE